MITGLTKEQFDLVKSLSRIESDRKPQNFLPFSQPFNGVGGKIKDFYSLIETDGEGQDTSEQNNATIIDYSIVEY
jgi:hypothetical protein